MRQRDGHQEEVWYNRGSTRRKCIVRGEKRQVSTREKERGQRKKRAEGRTRCAEVNRGVWDKGRGEGQQYDL
jgi:hypothetical protein